MSKQRRTFTCEFKVEAVKLIAEQGCSFAEAARQLGVSENQLRTWKKKLNGESQAVLPGHGNRSSLEAELHRLRAENKRLAMERDLLKKAAAFFAMEAN